MKKIFLMGAALCMVFAMSSCKSKESAYKKAYDQQTEVATTPVVQQQTTPVAVAPVQTTTVTPQADYSNVSVRTENVTLVSGPALKAYSVVVGSFGLKSNATGLAATLQGKGYTPRVVQASTTQGTMYRVVASSYDSKGDAAQSRNSLEGAYPGAWLLYQK